MSPAEKLGNEAGAKNVPWVFYALARADGDAVMYGGTGPFGETTSGSDVLSISQRSEEGWSTRAVLPAGEGIDASQLFGEIPNSSTPSADFSRVLFSSTGSFVPENPVFGAGSEAAGVNLVNDDWSVSWLSKPVVKDPVPEPGHIQPSFPLEVAGASPDLQTDYFGYFGTLVPEDESRAPNVEATSVGGPWGFYEWHDGTLVSAAGLPSGEYKPFGALAAGAHAKGPGGLNVQPDEFHNQVSQNGRLAFFVSPDPEASHPAGDPTELYLHESDNARGVLVSRDELAGGGPAPAYTQAGSSTGVTEVLNPTAVPSERLGSYVYASPDGSRAFFESMDKLAHSSGGEEPTGLGPWTYEFNFAAEKVTYLPSVVGPILAVSTDGSRFLFESVGKPAAIDLWSQGTVSTIATFSSPSGASIAPARSTSDGSVFVWETNAELFPGSFNNGGGFMQVYRYDVATATLSCLSCPPEGVAPSGDAHLSNDDEQTEAPETVANFVKNVRNYGQVLGSRSMSSDGGRVFFDTPEALLPQQDVNGVRDVYEWKDGKLYLVSSGQGTTGSFYLDNSESGNDVFFATADSLVEADYDKVYDVYDARVGGGFRLPAVPVECRNVCQGAANSPPVLGALTSAVFEGPGNPPSSSVAAPPGKKPAGHTVKKKANKHARAPKGKGKRERRTSKGKRASRSARAGSRPRGAASVGGRS